MIYDIILKVKFEVWLVVFFTLMIVFVSYLLRNLNKKTPPGPIGLPIVGYLPFLGRDVHVNFYELAQRHGEVFSVRLGSQLVVVLNGTDSIKEAFGKPEFLGRPESDAFSILLNKSPFFASDLHVWQEQRRFVVHALKDLGLGRSKIECHIQEEIHHFLKVLESHKGKPMNLMTFLTPSISNNMGALLFGQRYEDYNHPERQLLDESIDIVSTTVIQTSPYIFFPWILHVPFLMRLFNIEDGVKAAQRSDKLLLKRIKEHKDTLDPENIRDFVDSYLIEMKSRQEKDKNTSFTDRTLAANAGDLLGAGSETVRTSISWCMYIIAAFPDIQEKVQEEISEVVGPDRDPEMQDQKKMPYTHAVLLEMMRWKTVVPVNILRSTTSDTTVLGYEIPKNTIVIANFWAVHHNPRYWENPEVFNPGRFLCEDKKTVKKSVHYMPFSVGKRSCPGESMAIMEAFLYFVSILQKFDVRFPDGYVPTFDAELFTAYKLRPHRLCFITRN